MRLSLAYRDTEDLPGLLLDDELGFLGVALLLPTIVRAVFV
jgi:hypothetical protein